MDRIERAAHALCALDGHEPTGDAWEVPRACMPRSRTENSLCAFEVTSAMEAASSCSALRFSDRGGIEDPIGILPLVSKVKLYDIDSILVRA